MSLVVRSIFDDVIRKMLMSVKDLIYFESIHDGAIIPKFRDSIFSQSEVMVEGGSKSVKSKMVLFWYF